jgi:germination protein, Ger(x)C family
MKKVLTCFIALVIIMSSFAGCYSYKDMNRVMFYTMGLSDERDGTFVFYGEGFKAFRAEGEKAGKEKRILLYGEGHSLIEAVEVIRNSANYPIDYSGNKSMVYSKRIAESGVEDILDLVNRDQKPSRRVYFYVYDGDAPDLISITLEDEQFIGLYLYELMNSQKDTLGVISSQYYEFIENMNTGSGINVLPVIKKETIREMSKSKSEKGNSGSGSTGGGNQGSSQSGGSEGSGKPPLDRPFLYVSGGAVFVGTKMAAQLDNRELETYKLLTSKVMSGLVETENPDYKDKEVGFTVLKNKFKPKVTIQDGRIKLDYKVDLKVVMLQAEKGIKADPETIQKLKTNLEKTTETRVNDLFEKMKKEKIDFLNIKRKLELARLDPKTDDLMDITDFNVSVKVTIDGLGELKEAYY